MAGFYDTVGERSTIEFQFQYDKEQLQALREMILAIKNDANIKIDPKGLKELDQWLKRINAGASSFANITTESKMFGNNIKESAKSTASLIKQLNAIDSANDNIICGVDLVNQGLSRSLQNIKTTKSILDKFGETLFNSAKWTLATTAVKAIQGSFSNAAKHVTQLDKSLNNIRIVTKQTAEQMEEFTKNANKLAQQLGTATNKFAQASLIYYQQGLNDAEVEKRTLTTIKAANVTKQAVSEVSENLTALWNGFQITQDRIEESVDKIAAVAAHSASNLAELTTAMSKTSSVAKTLGVDLDQLTAQIATIISTTRQAPETVGTALRTIYARMADLVQDGTDEFGVSLGKVSGQLESVGINILSVDGQLRDMGDVIDDIAKKWNSWSAAQKQAIAIAVAGKRQYNNLFALFENWDQYSANLEQSKNSLGELQKQQDIFLESYEAKFQKISTAWEEVVENFKDDTAFKGILDLVNGLVKGVGILSKAAGGGAFGMMSVGSLLLNRFQQPIKDNLTQIRYSQLTRDTNKYNAAVYSNKDVQSSNRKFSVDEVGQMEGLEIIENFEKNITYKLAKALQSALNVFSEDEIIVLQKKNEELKQKYVQEARMQARGYDKETDLGFDIADNIDYDKMPNGIDEDKVLGILTQYLAQKANKLSSGELYDGDTLIEYFDKALGLDKNNSTITDYLVGNKDEVKKSIDLLNDQTKEIKAIIKQNKKLQNDPESDGDVKGIDHFATGGRKDNKGNISIASIDKSVLNPGDPDRYLVQARVADGEVLQVIPKKDVKNPVDAGVRVSGWDKYAQIPGYRDGANIYVEGEIPHSPGIYAYKQVRGKGKNQEYIGQARDLYSRFKSHLRRNFTAEDSIDFALQDPNNTFIYKIIKNLDNITNKEMLSNELNRFEMNGIAKRDSYNKGYNKTKGNFNVETNNNKRFNKNFYDIDNWTTKNLKLFEQFQKGGALDNTGRRYDNFKQINFDMDGTIADLYGRFAELYPEWNTRSGEFWKMVVDNGDAEGYRSAKPLVDMNKFKEVLTQLQQEGWRWGITSWLAGGKDPHPEYDELVRQAKKDWLKHYGLNPDEIHIVKYGTPKADVTSRHKGVQILFDDEPQNRDFKGAREVAKKKGLEPDALDNLPFTKRIGNIAYDVNDIIGTLEALLTSTKEKNAQLSLVNPIIDNRDEKQKRGVRWKKKYPLTDPKFPTVRFQDDEAVMLMHRAYNMIEDGVVNGSITQEQKDLIDMLLSSVNVYFGDYGDHKGNMAYKKGNDLMSVFFGKHLENEGTTLVHELLHVAQARFGSQKLLKNTKNLTKSLKDWKYKDSRVNDYISTFKKGREQNVGKAIFMRNFIETFANDKIQDEWQKNRFILAARSMLNDMTRGEYSQHLNIATHPKDYYAWGKGTENRSIAGMESNSEYGALAYLNGDFRNLLKECFTELGLKDFIDNIESDFVGIFENPDVMKEMRKFKQIRGYKNGGIVDGSGSYDGGRIQLSEIPEGVLQPGDPDRYLLQARVADGEALQVIPKSKVRGLPGYDGGINNGSNIDNSILIQIRDQLFNRGIRLADSTVKALNEKTDQNKAEAEDKKREAEKRKEIENNVKKEQENKKSRIISSEDINRSFEKSKQAINDTANAMDPFIKKMNSFFGVVQNSANFAAGRIATGVIGESLGQAIKGEGSILGSAFAIGGALKNLSMYTNPNDFKNMQQDWDFAMSGKTINKDNFDFKYTSKNGKNVYWNKELKRLASEEEATMYNLKDGYTQEYDKDSKTTIFRDKEGNEVSEQEAIDKGLGAFAKTKGFNTALVGVGMFIGALQSIDAVMKAFAEKNYKLAQEGLNSASSQYKNTSDTITKVNELTEQYKKQQISAVELKSSLSAVTKELHDSSISFYAFTGNIKKLNQALAERQIEDANYLSSAARNAAVAGNDVHNAGLFSWFTNGVADFSRMTKGGMNGTNAGADKKAKDILAKYGLTEEQALDRNYLSSNTSAMASFSAAYNEMQKNAEVASHSGIANQMRILQNDYSKVFDPKIMENALESTKGQITGVVMQQEELTKTSNSLLDFNNVLDKVIKDLEKKNISASIDQVMDSVFNAMAKNMDDYTKLSVEQEKLLIKNIQASYLGDDKSISNEKLVEKIATANLNTDDKQLLNQYSEFLDFTKGLNGQLEFLTNVLGESAIRMSQAQSAFGQLQSSKFAQSINTTDKDKSNFIKTLTSNYGSVQEGLNKITGGRISMDTMLKMNGGDLTMMTLLAQQDNINKYTTNRSQALKDINSFRENINKTYDSEGLKDSVYKTMLHKRQTYRSTSDFAANATVMFPMLAASVINPLFLAGGLLAAANGTIGAALRSNGAHREIDSMSSEELRKQRKQLHNNKTQTEGVDKSGVDLKRDMGITAGGALAGAGLAFAGAKLGGVLGTAVGPLGTLAGAAIGAGIGALAGLVMEIFEEGQGQDFKARSLEDSTEKLLNGSFDKEVVQTLIDAAATPEEIDQIEQLAEANRLEALSAAGLNAAKQSAIEMNKQLIQSYQQMATQALENIKNLVSTTKTLNEIKNDFNANGNELSIDNWATFMNILKDANADTLKIIQRNADGTMSIDEEALNANIRQQKTLAMVGLMHGTSPLDYKHNSQQGEEALALQQIIDRLDVQHKPLDKSKGVEGIREQILAQATNPEEKKAFTDVIKSLGLDKESEQNNYQMLLADLLGISSDSEMLEATDGILLYTKAIYKTLTAIAKKDKVDAGIDEKEQSQLDNVGRLSSKKQIGGKNDNVKVNINGEEMTLAEAFDGVKDEESFKNLLANAKVLLEDPETKNTSEETLQKYFEANGATGDLLKLLSKSVNEFGEFQVDKLDKILGNSQTYIKLEKDAKTKAAEQYKTNIDWYANVNKRLLDINTALGLLNEQMQHIGGASNWRQYNEQVQLYHEQATAQQETRNIAFTEKNSYAALLAQYGVDVSDRVGAQQQIAQLGYSMEAEQFQALQQYYQKYVAADQKEHDAAQAEQTARFAEATAKFERAVANQVNMIEYLDITKQITQWENQQRTNRSFRDQFRDNYSSENVGLMRISNLEQQQLHYNMEAVRNIERELADAGKYNIATGQYNLSASNDYRTGTDALKKMQEFVKAAQANADSIYQNLQQAYQNLNSYLQDTATQLDFIQSRFNLANNALTTVKTLMDTTQKAGLNYFIKADQYYKSSETISKRQIDALYEEAAMWENLSNELEEGSKEQYQAQQNYINSIQEARQAVIQLANTYKEDLVNGIDESIAKFEEFIALGNKTDFFSQIMGLDQEQADKYYDEIERIGKVQSLTNKVNLDLESNDYTQKARKQILEFYEQEKEYLSNKEQMTEQDVKYTNLKYELLKKQIALEEAQNAKNSMKLVRNAQGNWSYQYVADNNETDQLKEDINDIHQQIQDLSTSTYQTALNNYIKIAKEFQTQLDSIEKNRANGILTDEEADEQVAELTKRYQNSMGQAANEYTYWQEQVGINTADWAKDIYAMNSEAFNEMSEELQKIIDATKEGLAQTYNDTAELIEQNFSGIADYSDTVLERSLTTWDNYANQIIELWTADNGESVKAQMQAAIVSIGEKFVEFNSYVEELNAISDLAFNSDNGFISSVNRAVQSTNNLNSEVDKLTRDGKENILDLSDQVDKLEYAWTRATATVESANASLQKLNTAVHTQQEQVKLDLAQNIALLQDFITKANNAATAAGKIKQGLEAKTQSNANDINKIQGLSVKGNDKDGYYLHFQDGNTGKVSGSYKTKDDAINDYMNFMTSDNMQEFVKNNGHSDPEKYLASILNMEGSLYNRRGKDVKTLDEVKNNYNERLNKVYSDAAGGEKVESNSSNVEETVKNTMQLLADQEKQHMADIANQQSAAISNVEANAIAGVGNMSAAMDASVVQQAKTQQQVNADTMAIIKAQIYENFKQQGYISTELYNQWKTSGDLLQLQYAQVADQLKEEGKLGIESTTEHQIQAATDFYLKESEMSAEEKKNQAEILQNELSGLVDKNAAEYQEHLNAFTEKYGPAAEGILSAFEQAAQAQIDAANAASAALTGAADELSEASYTTNHGEKVTVKGKKGSTIVNGEVFNGTVADSGAVYGNGWIIAPRSQVGPGFASGGYTGSWGAEGKFALLHEKEQIFNADDTQLLYNAAQLLNSNNNLKAALLEYTANNNSKTPIEQYKEKAGDVYNVTANFPNANDAEEIRQALLSLPNIMSQYITTSNTMQGE